MFPDCTSSVVLPKPYPSQPAGALADLLRNHAEQVHQSKALTEAVIGDHETLRRVMESVWWDELVFLRLVGRQEQWRPASELAGPTEWWTNVDARMFARRRDGLCVARFDFVVIPPFSFACFIDMAKYTRATVEELKAALIRIEVRLGFRQLSPGLRPPAQSPELQNGPHGPPDGSVDLE